MSLSIVHLSDLHIKETNHYMIERAGCIVDAIKSNIDLETVLVLVSGDIGYSGQEKEYALAKRFFNTLENELKKHAKEVRLLIVPGNHDINFNGQPRSRNDILKIRKKGYSKTDIDDEINKFENFWSFVKDYPMEAFSSSKLVDVKNLVLGDKAITINLINSAMFSLFKEENADSDKDLHYLPHEELQKIRRNVASLNICLMHHNIEYFCEEIKNKFHPILDQETDLIFSGHNHFISVNKTQTSQMAAALSFQGGKLNDASSIESSFDVIICDDASGEFQSVNFHWNNSYHLYESSFGRTLDLKGNCIPQSFQKWLNSSGSSGIPKPYTDFFVFPRLKITQENDFDAHKEKDILTFEGFNEAIKDKRVVEISGEDLAGKTTLLKYLYENYKKYYRPFIIISDDITTSIDKTIKAAFERQYGVDNAAFQQFLQLSSSSKIVFIDDIETVSEKYRRTLLQKLLESFDKVIYSTNKTFDFDINKLMMCAIEKGEESILHLKIEPFYSDKRDELIHKICECINEQSSEEEIENMASQVNIFIKNQIKLFSLNPAFIIMFTRCYVSNYVDRSNTNAFNEVFSSNISAAIEKARKKTQISDDLIILQEVASYAHFHKQYPISNRDFNNIVDTFNEKHRAYYNSADVINELVEAKILKTEENGVVFVNKSYLAFFVAKWLNRQIHNGKGQSELKNVVDNICYNINSDILLFLTYLTENVNALYVILNAAREFSKIIDEYDFDNKPMSVLTDWSASQTPPLVSQKDKKQIKKGEVDRERQIKEQEKIEKVNIYDENIGGITAIQTTLLKYLEIIAKILPNFSHLLDASQQDDFVEEIYKLPNRIISFMFRPFEENKDQLLKELEEVIKDKHLEENYKSPEDIKHAVSNLLNAMMLTIYDMTAENTVTERTIVALDSFNYKANTLYFVQNIMMHEQLRGFSQYVQRSDELFDKTKSVYIKHLLRLIFRKHCFYHDVVYIRDGQKYLDKYLPQTKGKEKRLLEQKVKMKKRKGKKK